MKCTLSSYCGKECLNCKKVLVEFSLLIGLIIKIGCRSFDVNYALLLTLHLSTKIDSVSLNLITIPSVKYTLLIFDSG